MLCKWSTRLTTTTVIYAIEAPPAHASAASVLRGSVGTPPGCFGVARMSHRLTPLHCTVRTKFSHQRVVTIVQNTAIALHHTCRLLCFTVLLFFTCFVFSDKRSTCTVCGYVNRTRGGKQGAKTAHRANCACFFELSFHGKSGHIQLHRQVGDIERFEGEHNGSFDNSRPT